MSDWTGIVSSVMSGSVALAVVWAGHQNGKRLKEHETELALYQKLYSKRFDTYQRLESFFSDGMKRLKPVGGEDPKLEFMLSHESYQAFRRAHDDIGRSIIWLIRGSIETHENIIKVFHCIDKAFDEASEELNFDIYKDSEWNRISDTYGADLRHYMRLLLRKMQQDYFILHLDTLEHSESLKARKELGSPAQKTKRRIWHLLTRPIWLSRRQRKIYCLMNNDPEIQSLLNS